MVASKKIRIAISALGVIGLIVGAPLVGLALMRKGEALPKHGPAVVMAAPSVSAPAADVENDFVGVLLPPRMADLSPRSDGKVLDVLAKPGQTVHAGNVIVAFDLRESRQELAMAEAQLRVVRADQSAAFTEVEVARKRVERRKATVTIGGKKFGIDSDENLAAATAEYNAAQAHASSATARVAEQKAKIEQLRVALEESELRAPFDGIVSFVNFEPASRVHGGEVVARVVGGQGLRARVAVPEESSDLTKLPRMRIQLENRELAAIVAQITREPEPASRAFIVEVTVDSSGMSDSECAALAGRPIRASFMMP